jgi:hypothetical protein
MVKRESTRRRTLIGLASIVFGASGFVASGAVELGSEGSLSDDWVPVEGTNQAIDLGPVQTDTGEQSSQSGNGDGDGDSGNGDTGGSTSSEAADQNTDDGTNTGGNNQDDDTGGNNQDDDTDDTGGNNQDDDTDDTGGNNQDDDTDDTGGDSGDGGSASTRVQVLTEPDNPGNAVNAGGPVTWSGSVVDDAVITETSDGFFQGIKNSNLNKQGTTVYGILTDGIRGYPTTPAFIIANVGPENGGIPETPVSVSMALYDGDTEIITKQFQFPYRAVDASGSTFAKGSDLSDSVVTLGVGDVIEVVVVFDTNGGTSQIESVDSIRFSATGVND